MSQEQKLERMLTVPEVARLLNVHPNTLRRWADQGLIRAHRINSRGDRRFERKDIAEFLQKFQHITQVAQSDRRLGVSSQ